MRISVEVILYLVSLCVLWTTMPLWAYATWRHRKSLYVRVRQPVWLLADLALGLSLMTLICIKGMTLHLGQDMPCALSNGAAALGMVWMPGVMLCGHLQLWYASTIMESKTSKVAMLRRFRVLLSGVLCLLTLLGLLLATGTRPLCFSNICHNPDHQGHCYWGAQYLLLLPLGALGWGATLLSWHLLSSTGRLERLGLMVEFWRQALITLPLMGAAFLVTALVDMGLVPATGVGQCAVSGLWLLACASRFVILHMLPSFAYGYFPQRSLCRRGKVAPLLLPTPLHSPLLPPPPAASPGADRDHTHSQSDIFHRAIHALQPPPLQSAFAFPSSLLLYPPLGEGGEAEMGYELPAAIKDTDEEEDNNNNNNNNNRGSNRLRESEGSRYSSFVQQFKGLRASLSLHARSSSPSPSSSSRSSRASSSRPSVGSPLFASSSSHLAPLPLPLSLPTPLPSMSLQDILGCGNDALIASLLSFCRTLLCDHWVLFLLTLHPYYHHPSSPPSPSSPLPPSLPAAVPLPLQAMPMPPEVLRGVYTIFLAPDSPLLAPVDMTLLRSLRQLIGSQPGMGHRRDRGRKMRMLHEASLIRERDNPGAVTRGFQRLFARMQQGGGGKGKGKGAQEGRGDEEEEAEAPEDHDAAITRLLQEAYCEVDRLVCEEALPMFKSYMTLRDTLLTEANNSHNNSHNHSASYHLDPSQQQQQQQGISNEGNNSSRRTPREAQDGSKRTPREEDPTAELLDTSTIHSPNLSANANGAEAHRRDKSSLSGTGLSSSFNLQHSFTRASTSPKSSFTTAERGSMNLQHSFTSGSSNPQRSFTRGSTSPQNSFTGPQNSFSKEGASGAQHALEVQQSLSPRGLSTFATYKGAAKTQNTGTTGEGQTTGEGL